MYKYNHDSDHCITELYIMLLLTLQSVILYQNIETNWSMGDTG